MGHCRPIGAAPVNLRAVAASTAALSVLAAGVTSCSGGLDESRAVEAANVAGTICVYAGEDGRAMTSTDLFVNTSDSPVQVTLVSLDSASGGLELVDWVLELRSEATDVWQATFDGWLVNTADAGNRLSKPHIVQPGEEFYVTLLLTADGDSADRDPGTSDRTLLTYSEVDSDGEIIARGTAHGVDTIQVAVAGRSSCS